MIDPVMMIPLPGSWKELHDESLAILTKVTLLQDGRLACTRLHQLIGIQRDEMRPRQSDVHLAAVAFSQSRDHST
jgi:hypothetical protein